MVRIPLRTASSWLAVPVLALALTGCADKVATSITERAVEAGGENVDVDIDSDGGEVTVRGEGGEVFSTGRELPDDFPDDVPLVDGEVISGVSTETPEGRGWAVSVEYDGSAEAAVDDAISRLESAGFSTSQEGTMVMGEMRAAMLEGEKWSVSLTALESEQTIVQYVVVDPQG